MCCKQILQAVGIVLEKLVLTGPTHRAVLGEELIALASCM